MNDPQACSARVLRSSTESTDSEPQGTGNILCTHDGVLLKKTTAEHITDLSTSGSLSLVEYVGPRHLYIEWRPNDNILIADDSQDQGDWALVDKISRRIRTTSECQVFNTKPPSDSNSSLYSKPRVIRTSLDILGLMEVRHRAQIIRFIRNSDGCMHSEYFFQHGNAEQFVQSMCERHIINFVYSNNMVNQYEILNTETQKLKKTFAELDIGYIKTSQLPNDTWMPNGLGDFFSNLSFQRRTTLKERPNSLDQRNRELQKASTSADNFQMLGISYNNSAGSPDSQSQDSFDKSPIESDLENVKEQDEKIVNNLPERETIIRGDPLSEMQWIECHTKDGCISDATLVKALIFRGGIEHTIRAEVWKYLLNYYRWDDNEVQRIERRERKAKEYFSMKAQWLSMSTIQEKHFSGYRERKCQIEKDVNRTDRTQTFFAGENNPNIELLQGILMTYVMYNYDLGYVQGMSDLLAPILEVQENQVDAFWCFVGFMEIVSANFALDQAAMKTQFHQLRRLLEFANPRLFNYMLTHDSDNMYFCFRWLLIWYKREFSNDDVLKLWECLWTGHPCPNFHVLISAAILDHETDIIIESKYDFNNILKHVNELSGSIDIERTLTIAEAIYVQLKSVQNLPNDIRLIIGEPLLEPIDDPISETKSDDDDFDELIKELSIEDKRKQQQLLEEACEMSMMLNFFP